MRQTASPKPLLHRRISVTTTDYLRNRISCTPALFSGFTYLHVPGFCYSVRKHQRPSGQYYPRQRRMYDALRARNCRVECRAYRNVLRGDLVSVKAWTHLYAKPCGTHAVTQCTIQPRGSLALLALGVQFLEPRSSRATFSATWFVGIGL